MADMMRNIGPVWAWAFRYKELMRLAGSKGVMHWVSQTCIRREHRDAVATRRRIMLGTSNKNVYPVNMKSVGKLTPLTPCKQEPFNACRAQ